MENPVEQINNIANMDDFLNFVVRLAMDSKEHPEEWANTTITDYLGQMASWVDDCSVFDDTVDWEKVDWYYVKKKYKLKVNFSYNIPFPSSYQSFHLF